jgi:hypothetical protein
MRLFYKQKNKLLIKCSYLLAWLLSFLGISVGVFGCVAYGPAGDNEQIKQLNDLKEESIVLERKNKNTAKEIQKLEKDVEKKEKAVKKLQEEKDTLEIILQNYEK